MTTNPLLSDAVVEAAMHADDNMTGFQRCKHMLKAAHKALTAAGYAVVPVEPTGEMLIAGEIPKRVIRLGNGQTAAGFGLGADARSIYKAMLAAAQTGEEG